MDSSAAPEFHSSPWASRPWLVWTFDAVAALGRITLGVPGEVGSQCPYAIMHSGRAPKALQGNQLPLGGCVAVVAVADLGAGIPGEYATLPGGPGDDVVQGAASGDVLT